MSSAYEWEGVARWLRGDRTGSARSLARRHEIDVYAIPGLRPLGVLGNQGDRVVIGYRQSLSEPYAEHSIRHELGHWAMRKCGVTDSEEGADYIAAATAMPSAAFLACFRSVGDDLPQLALPFGVTETSAALRLGELLGEALAVVAPLSVRVRGPEDWVWPDTETVRRWARAGRPGLKKTRLRDDRRRVVLRAIAG